MMVQLAVRVGATRTHRAQCMSWQAEEDNKSVVCGIMKQSRRREIPCSCDSAAPPGIWQSKACVGAMWSIGEEEV